MLRRLVELSLRRRGAVIALAALLLGYGVFVATRAKLDVFPEFAPPQVIVHTEAPGLSPEEVEALVTSSVENELNGAGDLESLRSQSILGLSVVTAVFRQGTDVLRARQMVSERLAQIAEELPEGVRAPRLAPLASSTSLVLAVGFTSAERTAMDLWTLAHWTARPRLLAVPGVASVVEFGGEVRQLQVQLRPDRLVAHQVSVAEVIRAAQQATGVRGAGFIETQNQRVPIRTEGQARTAAELGEAVVGAYGSAVVRLQDLARVVEAPAPKIGDAAIDGEPGVLFLVWSQYGANTLEVTRAVEAALEELRPALEAEKVTLHPRLFRPASFIEESIGNVRESLFVGGALVAAVLALFLFNARAAFISLTAIPLSLLGAVIVLDALGASLNTLTLGGLAIAIGEVVDDAIIDVENIFRRLRENRSRAAPLPAFEVVLEASLEVRSAVVHATFVVALVFLPVLALSGVQGKLFAPLAVAYVLATLASLGVALTITPALSFLLLERAAPPREPPYLRAMKRLHCRWLGALSSRPRRVLAGALLLSAGAAALLPTFGGEFLPEFQEGHLIVQMSMAPGSSARECLRLGRKASREVLGHPAVRSVSIQVGRAELGEDTAGTEFAELIVALKQPEEEEGEAVRGEIRRLLAGFPGARFAVKPFLEERIEETISGARGEVAVRIYGEDLDLLDRKAEEVQAVLARIPGSADLRFQRSEAPQTVVRLRRERLKLLGFRSVEVLEAVQVACQGAKVAQTFEGNRVLDVVVNLEESARGEPEALEGLLVENASGLRSCLSELAEVLPATGRHSILHDATRRFQEVTCNVQARDVASFVAEAKRWIGAEVVLPPGVTLAFAGTAEAEAQARRELLIHSLLAGAGIVLLLGVAFRRARNLLLALANLPLALVGGVLAVFFTGGQLSLGSLVGFVTLFGITTRNSILMVAHFEHLVAVEGRPWGPETALRGASERFVPVLVTGLVTALGLLPIALGAGKAGREIEGPMALVILGGLITSTSLNLLILPVLALRLGSFGAAASTVPSSGTAVGRSEESEENGRN